MVRTLTEQEVRIPVVSTALNGDMVIPRTCKSVVLFAHGSGSSRHSPRNRFVAGMLQDAGIGTLLFDLLTPGEDAVYETRFDIDLLAKRLTTATHWLMQQPEVNGFGIGYFGASTGSAAALHAAAELGPLIRAVVSRGGRPDLAGPFLPKVTAPVLLIVGGRDVQVLGLNRSAYGMIRAEKDLAIVPGATHLFEEPGTLEEASRLAVAWFKRHL